MANQRFTEWDKLRKALARSDVRESGKVATVLLEVFLERGGKLKVTMCREKGFCLESGEFSDWRYFLRDKSWLSYDSDREGKIARYYPGIKLAPYINREKQSRFEIATKNELDLVQTSLEIAIERKADKQDVEKKADREVVDGLASEVSHLRKVVEALIEKYDPPVTKQKVDTALVLVKK